MTRGDDNQDPTRADAARAREEAAIAALKARSAGETPLPPFQRVAGAVHERLARRRELKRRAAWAGGLGLAAAAAVVLAVTAWGPRPGDEVVEVADGARVAAAAGLVSVERGGAWVPVTARATLLGGDVVETGVGGRATLARPATARIEVGPETRVALDAWRDDLVAMRLERGTITSWVSPRAPGERYEIRTPTALIEVVGTAFVTTHDPARGTVVRGLEGTVRVSTLDGALVAFVRRGETQAVPLPAAAAGAEPAAGAVIAGSVAEGLARAGVRAAAVAPRPAAPVVAVEAAVETADAAVEARSASAPPRPERAPAAPAEAPEPPPETPGTRLAAAREAVAAGRVAEAVAALEALVATAPSRAAWALLGDAERMQGHGAEAARAYAAAVDAGDGDPGALVLDLGEALQAVGRGADAVSAWRGYLARFPEGRAVAGVAAALARAEAAAGETAEAERHWQLVLERAPRSPLAAEALTKLGRALLAAGRFDDAAALFEPFATADAGPLAETGLVGLAHARAGQGRWEAVKALAALYTSRFPGGRRGAEMEALAARAGAP